MPKYPVSDEAAARIEDNFSYHPPKEDQPDRYSALRETAKQFAFQVVGNVPPGREQSLALTKIEEASFWANAGIARGE